MGFTTVLTLIFIVLKLCHVINWSWFLVLLPTTLVILFWIGVVVLGAVVAHKDEMDRRL